MALSPPNEVQAPRVGVESSQVQLQPAFGVGILKAPDKMLVLGGVVVTPTLTRERSKDRPPAKGGGVPLASRRGCSRVAPTKKRADLGSSCHVGHGSAALVVGTTEIKKLRKSGLTSPTEKPAQTRRRIFF